MWGVDDMKALFTYDYGTEKMNKVRELGYEITYIHEREVKFNQELKDTEVLVTFNPFSTLDIAKLENLKLIQLTSIGINQVPVGKLQRQGITLCNNKGGYSIPMGEWIVLKTLEMLKNSKSIYERQKNKKWKIDKYILELYGKTVGFIGTGSIAHEAAKRLQGFGVTILGLNTNGTLKEYYDECYAMDQIDKMIPQCDVIVLTIPYTQKTHHLVNKSFMEKMKESSFLINVSRGSIIDEQALIKVLKEKKIKGAALDVFEKEPLSQDSPLWELDNVLISSHSSWVSEVRDERRFEMIYNNLRKYIQKEELKNVVDLVKGY